MVDRLTRSVLLGCLTISLAHAPGHAQDQTSELSNASLEDLTRMRISVSSFARKDEDLWKTPAAVFVILREDIARSAATSIPELLRMVPGLEVAQVNASTWAVSARGFNGVFADKLLVLVDGRSVFSELYSGVPWDQVDLPLEDIERIEVVRGPGAAVWGDNAVNGVVNIITRKAQSTLGGLVSGSAGRINESADIRYGASIGSRSNYRAYGNYVNRRPMEMANGENVYDGEREVRFGGRIDWQKSWADWITVTGNLYAGHLKEQLVSAQVDPADIGGRDAGAISGGHLLTRWEHKRATGDSALQVYYDDASRNQLGTNEDIRTLDIDFENHMRAGSRNDLVWGSEYRFTREYISGPVKITSRSIYHNDLIDGFLQDEVSLVPNRLLLTAGAKIQYGTLSHYQWQPSIRLLWAATDSQSYWIAASKAVVAPALQETSVQIPITLGMIGGVPLVATILGDPNFKTQYVYAYEAGYRVRLPHSATFDVAGFYNDNRRIRSSTTSDPVFVPFPVPELQFTILETSGYRGRSAGVESTMTWKPRSSVSLEGSYTWMQDHIHQAEPGNVAQQDSWNAPRNNLSGTASWNFAQHWRANSFVSYVGAVVSQGNPATGTPTSTIPAYTRVDLHVSHKLGDSFEFDGGVTNLQSPRHLEFGGGSNVLAPTYIPRSLYINAAWSF